MITLSTTLAVLDSCPKHNMVAYLEKSEGNAEFHEIIDFLKRSFIHPVSDQAKEIQHLKAQIKKLKKQAKPVIKHHGAWLQNPLFDEISRDTLDHMDTDNAQVVGRTRDIVSEEKEIDVNILSTEDVVSTDKEKVSIDRPIVSTNRSKVSTDRQIEGTDEQIESTDEGGATQATQTPTSTIFRDDETIAKVLLNMS
ncbi:hypothetical protein Tco_0472001, partial [Tanacetum coccineum]